jgi:predicted DNA-binding protein
MEIGTVTREDRADQPMYVRLPTELHEAVRTRAREEDRTMAQTIRVALRYYLNHTEPVA